MDNSNLSMQSELAAQSQMVLQVRAGACSDPGPVREHNEDAYLAQSPVFLVADGMGGHQAGEVASHLALESFSDLVGQSSVTDAQLQSCIRHAAGTVSALDQGGAAPGTTLTGLALSQQGERPCIRILNIGDSRTYHCNANSFSQITRDHSEVQELIDAGCITPAESVFSPRRNVITRALGGGAGPDVVADFFLLPAYAGDRFIICSDGLCNELSQTMIEAVARAVLDPQQAAEELVQRAVSAGGHDNVTVLVVDVLTASPEWENSQVGEETTPEAVDQLLCTQPNIATLASIKEYTSYEREN